VSYIVAIWEQPRTLPLPGDPASASALMEMLYRVHPGPNALLMEYVARITARFPNLGECDDAECVWSDGPLSGDGDEAVLNLGLQGDKCHRAMPFLVETARALGLSVFDAQEGKAFFPDGSSVGESGPRVTDFETTVLDALTPLLAAHGYARGPHKVQFIRKHADGWLGVTLRVDACWPPRFEFYLRPEVTYLPLHVQRTTIVYGTPQAYGENYSRGAEHAYPQRWTGEAAWPWINKNRLFTVRSMSELRLTLPFLLRQVETTLLPLLEQCTHPAGLDAVFNPPNLRDSPFFLQDDFNGYERGSRNVLLGHMVDNPRLRAICDEVERGMAGLPEWSSTFHDTRQCIKYVRAQRGWDTPS